MTLPRLASRARSLLLACCLFAMPQAWAADDTLRIGWTSWDDAEFVTRLAQRVLTDHMGYEVELVHTDIAPQYQGIANGDIDAMLMSWLPETHSDYMDRVGSEVVNLGILYDHARLGWVVPDYVPEDLVRSIDDLRDPAVQERLDGRIIGIDPGAGLTRLSRLALQSYGLDEDYELEISSGSGMTQALADAIEQQAWIVVTGWSPHWKFAAWDLRYLEDPRGELGDLERIHAIARHGLYQDYPDVATMLSRMWLPIDDLQQAMHEARETSYDEAVHQYIARNPARIAYWVSGSMSESSEEAVQQ